MENVATDPRCRIRRVKMKDGGADLTILAPLVENSRETIQMVCGSVCIRNKGDEPLTMERALFMLEQAKLILWESW
jgi:hypothetical protein